MRQVFLDKGMAVVKDVCQPLLEDHAVLVAVRYSFISSGTESATIANARRSMLLSNVSTKIKKVIESLSSHGIDGTAALIKSKLKGNLQTLGYSCSGQVIAVGKKVRKIRTGDFVACAGAGYANHADIVCVPENLVVKVRKQQHLKSASCTTIGAIALQGVRRAQIQLGESVCVIGLGLLGQITVQLLKSAGCTVFGVDLLDDRLELAKKVGADRVYNALDSDVQREIAFLTNHHGADATIITAASKSNEIVQHAMEITRKKGRVIVVGDVGLNLERNPLYAKEIDFLISCSYGPGRYDPAYEAQSQDYPYAYVRWTENRNMQAFVDLVESEKINIEALVTQEFGLDALDQAYSLVNEQNGLGVLLNFSASQQAELDEKQHGTSNAKKFSAIRFIPAVKDSVRVGFVGAGGFAKIKLMPLVAQLPNVSINAIVDADVATSLNVQRLYGAARALTNDQELFSGEDLVDAVVIASPHKYHCDQALTALRHGKAVFMEKPMVTDLDQYLRLTNFIEKNRQLPFCVDYNRSFAPYITKIKEVISERNSPLVVSYRMNAGFIAKEHWVQTDVGAGRIIGEACHIVDLFCFLTDAKPLSVSVESLASHNENLFPTDNFSAQFSFDDGSICTLLYTSLGHNQMGKERMELFFDSKSIVMNDYQCLTGFGLPHSFNEKTKSPDKGHQALLRSFFTAITQPEDRVMPISYERLAMVAHLTLVVDQLACQGGGSRTIG